MDSLRYSKYAAHLIVLVVVACFLAACAAPKPLAALGQAEMADVSPIAAIAPYLPAPSAAIGITPPPGAAIGIVPRSVVAIEVASQPAAAIEVMPAPPAAAGSNSDPAEAQAVGSFARWNFWVTDRAAGSSAPKVGVTIPLNARRYMRFRMTTLDFSALWKGVNRVGLSKHIGSFIDKKRASDESAPLEFVALVTAADPSAIEIVADQRQRAFSVDMDKLKASPPTSLRENGEGSKGLDKANLCEFTFEFTALRKGKHSVSVVLVERRTGIPMQVMAIEVQPESPIDEQIASVGSNVGIDTALASGADFSLVLQELRAKNRPVLIATMTAHDIATGENQFFAWNTGVGLNELQQLLGPYRYNLSTSPTIEALNLASWTFGRLLFAPQVNTQVEALSQENLDLATSAGALLFKAATVSAGMTSPSTLLVRLVSSNVDEDGSFSSPTLPLGAIALGPNAENAVHLGERMIVALVLPDQSLNPTLACPASWYIAQPPDDLDKYDAVSIAAKNSGSYWTVMHAGLKQQSKTLNELRGHLRQSDGNDQAEVVSYMGHNGASGLFFDMKAATALAPSDIQRVFAPSSVVILNACETATDTIKPGTLIGRLFSQNVGSAIATVTPVRGELAGAYMRCQAAVLEKKAELTVGELQLRTTQCLFSKERGEQWGGNGSYFQNYALNYFLVGNPYQKICVPKGPL